MKDREKHAHMRSAFNYAGLSRCNRAQAGAVVVKNGSLLSFGYNGTPPGWDNCCEDDEGNTKPEVRHAEWNAIMKIARSTESSVGASLFVTFTPCLRCSEMIAGCGIKDVYYAGHYKANTEKETGINGIDYLEKCGVKTYLWPLEEGE